MENVYIGQFFSKLYFYAISVGLLVILAGLLGAIFRYILLPILKGRLGEASINFWTRHHLDQNVYHLIPNVMLPTQDGTTQIDHVIVSRYGIFVIETKTYKGWIYGDENEAQWTQVIYRHKERFQNPLSQNLKHVKTLAELTGIPDNYFKSVVVFAGDSTFKTNMPPNVVHIRDYIRFIRAHTEPIIKDEQVPEIVQAIQEWAGTVDPQKKALHVSNLKKNHAPVSSEGQTPSCPRCGAQMVLRPRKSDGGRFWGCSKYPACHGNRNVA